MSDNNIPRGTNELGRSPEKNHTVSVMDTTAEETTKENSMLNVLLLRFDKLDKQTASIHTKIDTISNRIDTLEVDMSEVKQTQKSLQHQQDTLQQEQFQLQDNQEEQGKDIYALQGEVSYLLETTERLKRQNNIIIHGIAEDSIATDRVSRIISILCPRNTLPLREFRIGSIQPNKIRPLRVRLGNVNEVDSALKRSFHLKKTEYTGVYITRDHTSMQQLENKKRREAYKQQKEEEEKKQALAQGNMQEPHTRILSGTDSTIFSQQNTHATNSIPNVGNNKRSFGEMDGEYDIPPPNKRLYTTVRRTQTHEPSPDITAPR